MHYLMQDYEIPVKISQGSNDLVTPPALVPVYSATRVYGVTTRPPATDLLSFMSNVWWDGSWSGGTPEPLFMLALSSV